MTHHGTPGMLLLFLTHCPRQPKTKVTDLEARPISELRRETKTPPVIAITKTSDSTVTCFYSSYHVLLTTLIDIQSYLYRGIARSLNLVDGGAYPTLRSEHIVCQSHLLCVIFIFSLSVGIRGCATESPARRRSGPPNDNRSRR